MSTVGNVVKATACLAMISTISACGGSGGLTGLPSAMTASGFATVSGSTANISLTSEANDSVTSAGVGLVAMASGSDVSQGQMNAVAGIASGANVGSVVTTGTATYNARYQYHVIDGVFRTSTTINGTRDVANEENITLNADFDAGTLTGSDTQFGAFGNGIVVNGTITGTNLGGSVQVNHDFVGLPAGSVNTTLQGQIGSTGVIGAFHGRDSNTVAAGGFVGTP